MSTPTPVAPQTRAALEELKAEYFFAVDNKLWQELSDLFTEDATFAGVGFTPAGPADFAGRTAALLEHVHSMHYGFQPVFTPDPTNPAIVHGRWAMQDHLTWDPAVTSLPGTDADAYAFHGFGYYEEFYRLIEEGWRIAHMHLIRTRFDITTAGVKVQTFTPRGLHS